MPLRALPAELQEAAMAIAARAHLPAEQVLAGTWADLRALLERLLNEQAVEAAIAQVYAAQQADRQHRAQAHRGEAPMVKPALCLKYNDCTTPDPCALCGARTAPQIGVEIFVEGTWGLVCDRCAKLHAPELFLVRAAYEATVHMVDAICEVKPTELTVDD
jgi:hypothetical protein